MAAHRKPKTINPDEIDPSVYYYDEVYDDMQHAPDESSGTDKKPKQKQGSKYIQGIIETAERRKSEKEIRKFKKFARDRDEALANDELDKTEVYVSKSYEKKLKEMQNEIKKHSQLDNERTLNSFKLHKSQDQVKKSVMKTSEAEQSRTVSEQVNEELDERKAHPSQSSSKIECSLEEAKPRRPKTIEERREYLRIVLKKRTVGETFKAAQERYWQRKSIS